MPTYEYVCEGCGNEWEFEQRISEDPIKKCPKCGKQKAKRAISGGNFILKGGGWYADLYSSSSGSGSGGSSKSLAPAPSSEAKSEAAPAPAAEAKPAKSSKKKAAD